MAKLPFATIRDKCFSFVRAAAALYDVQVSPSFSLMSDASAQIESEQPSLSDYDKVLFHIGVNLLTPRRVKNTVYPMTEALFEVISL